MNHEELQNLIKDSIKNEKLRDYLLKYFEYDCKLNINLPPALIEKATQRFKNKIKTFQKIEKALPDGLILPGDFFLLGHKLETLRLNLAILYANDTDEITEDICNETKNFISEILSKNIKLKLKYFDLIILLLEKIIEYPHSNKKFTDVLDLLKLFINESSNHPNEEDLKYVINLEANNANKTDILTIKKMFYGIIRELNKKLIFQDLLDRLIKIVDYNNSPLTQFCFLFITKCLKDLQMDAIDFNQLIGLVYQALQRFPEPKLTIKGFRFNKLLNNKKMSEYLAEFEKDFREKIFEQIINEPVKVDLENNQPNSIIDKTLEFNISNYFPISIKNKKLQTKFIEARFEYNQTFEKKITTNDHSFFKQVNEKVLKISNTANTIIEKGKIITANAVANLEEFAESSSNRVTSFIKKDSENLSTQKREEIDEKDLNNSLIQAKAPLERMSPSESKINLNVKSDADSFNNANNNQSNPRECLISRDKLNPSFIEESKKNIQKISVKFEETFASIKEYCWFAQLEVNQPNLANKIFYRGCFHTDLSIKKIKAKLNDTPSFNEINDLISKQSFWSLLFDFGIVRWPWKNKKFFSDIWVKQLCLFEIITQTEKIKINQQNRDDKLFKIIELLEAFSLNENEPIVNILNNFKKYIVVCFKQPEIKELKNNNCLNEKIKGAKTSANRNLGSFFPVLDLSRSAADVSSQSIPTPILVN
ncbi:hypothetical protein [Rickettsiella endosymbiont of Rhagonycha lignosa]|uniref:hypothetical protein n=1 Tax=Rickettsiella endosymbiont of Rhagonycha lignosa TaxID=3077937 RepID=UPI00313CECC2